jgi:signal transduction histidine kinase
VAAVHPYAIAGFLSALAAAHATVAVYSLALYGRPAPEASGGPRSGRRVDPAPPRAEHELLVFGLLNVAVVAVDGGLALAYALSGEEPARALGGALLVAEAGRVGGVAFLLHFILQYARAIRPRSAVTALYGVAFLVAMGCATGSLGGLGEPRREVGWILGVTIPLLHAEPTTLGALSAGVTVSAAAVALLILARALLRGRREAVGFVGLALLAVAVGWDALRNLGWVKGPPVAPFGFAAFVNGVIMTLLGRFTALRSQLEGRARHLKDRTRQLARAYEELRAAQDELVRKEQLTAVGELSAVVAHEVRNPLAIISNAVATLRRSGVDDTDRATLLRILDEESSRLNRLVGDLLRFARPIALERQLVSLRELCERGMALADNKVGLDAELVEPDPTVKVWGDPNLLRQVIDNLIDNAIQAMASGGVLTVTLVNLDLDGTEGVEIQIQDTGDGMDTEVRARALDPFFTTRPSGTGLGLAIVARIVDAHGGVLRIKSKSGAGTVMHVFLPRTEPERRRPSGALTKGEPPPPPARQSSEPPLPTELQKALARPRR